MLQQVNESIKWFVANIAASATGVQEGKVVASDVMFSRLSEYNVHDDYLHHP